MWRLCNSVTTNMATCVTQRFYHILSRNTCTSLEMLRGYHFLKQAGRMLCTPAPSIKVKDCYLLLGVDWSATVVDVREAYLKLAKQYHPDCGRTTADAGKFARIEQAYRVVMDHVTTAAQQGPEVSDLAFEKEILDIHHTAPQHRQYLEYEGIGFGSPSTRQKQYQNYRVQRASDKVIDHKTRQFGDQETSIAEPEKRAIRRSKYSKVIDRLVEDLIQEAMSKGEFKNLSGSGKPLKLEQELYVEEEKIDESELITGSVKWFNLVKGFGFITRDDAQEDVFVHQSAIKSKGYRRLEEGEKVQFKTVSSEKGKIAVFVTSPDGGNVRGLSHKCRVKKGARKYTSLCYNCNENGHRMKKCPYARRNERACHKCGAQSHLIRTCPKLMKDLQKAYDDSGTESTDDRGVF